MFANTMMTPSKTVCTHQLYATNGDNTKLIISE